MSLDQLLVSLPRGFIEDLTIANPQFWMDIYNTGKVGSWIPDNIFVVIAARLMVAIIILVAAWIANMILRKVVTRALSAVTRRSGGANRRLSTLHGLILSTLSYTLYLLAIVLVLFKTRIITWHGLMTLVGAASVIGLAIGFGAQKLIRDVITGLFILGEGQFDVGDWVTIGGVTGRVEEMGLRVTRLRDEQGRMYVIANGDITQVFNASRGAVKVVIDLPVPRVLPLEPALQTIQRATEAALAAREIKYQEYGKLAVRVAGMDATNVTVRVSLWVPITERDTADDAVRRRLLTALEEMQSVEA